MPTIVSHAAVPLAVGVGVGKQWVPRPLLLTGIAASMLPDADVIFFRFGATYDSMWAHRGFTHSIGFAIALGLLAAMAFRRKVPAVRACGFIAAAALSHGLLDMLTSGGHGIAILWPFSSTRFFFDWRPIQVSPLATSRFLARATTIALSELRWIWAPAIVVAVALRAIRPLKGMQA